METSQREWRVTALHRHHCKQAHGSEKCVRSLDCPPCPCPRPLLVTPVTFNNRQESRETSSSVGSETAPKTNNPSEVVAFLGQCWHWRPPQVLFVVQPLKTVEFFFHFYRRAKGNHRCSTAAVEVVTCTHTYVVSLKVTVTWTLPKCWICCGNTEQRWRRRCCRFFFFQGFRIRCCEHSTSRMWHLNKNTYRTEYVCVCVCVSPHLCLVGCWSFLKVGVGVTGKAQVKNVALASVAVLYRVCSSGQLWNCRLD